MKCTGVAGEVLANACMSRGGCEGNTGDVLGNCEGSVGQPTHPKIPNTKTSDIKAQIQRCGGWFEMPRGAREMLANAFQKL